MQIKATAIEGVFIIESNIFTDERGKFLRTYCSETFQRHGLCLDVSQCSVSVNYRRGTLRGLHYQRGGHAEVKLVRCIEGAIYDVAVDLRPHSKTYLQHIAVELSSDNGLALLIPENLAHGFQTLTSGAVVHYQISVPYNEASSAGCHYLDKKLNISWPLPVSCISEKDSLLPPIVTDW